MCVKNYPYSSKLWESVGWQTQPKTGHNLLGGNKVKQIVHFRQSAHGVLLFSTGYRVCTMHSTWKWTNLLLWVRGLIDPCSAEALLVNFPFCQQFLYHRNLMFLLCSESPCIQQGNTCLGARLCCGNPGARMPEKYKPSDYIPSFCSIYLEIQQLFLFYIK